ncbi:DUF1501 domain-containing protein [Planctomycetales bacterium ZRK34]|nr:DUF1501 domain-containing protein [Planctomycetales bacterium ZRK34]
MKKDIAKKMDGHSRRQFAEYVAKSLLGVGLYPMFGKLPQVNAATGGKARNCIYLYMSGGMSHIDTFDPKPGTEVQGPTPVIGTNVSGIQLGGGLKKTAQVMNHIALVRSIKSTTGAHEPGYYIMHTAYSQRGTIRHPGMGAWLLHFQGKKNEVLPGNVTIGGGYGSSGFLPSALGALPIGNPEGGLPYGHRPFSEKEFYERLSLADAYDKPFRRAHEHRDIKGYTNLYADAIKLMNSKETEVFDLGKESQAMRSSYGMNNFGQGCLLARRLIEKDVRFVEVSYGGWDTHTDNFDAMDNKVPVLDQALAALISDLSSRGLLDSTLIVLASEFGRTPRINGNMGRDHHPAAFTGLLAGGGIQGGQVYGSSDSKGFHVEDKAVRIPDFNATIGYALGLPLDQVVKSPSGRPFTVGDKGKPITDIF